MDAAEAIVDTTTVRDNKQSLFLRLPPEVRNTIYRFAIDRRPIHIIESMNYLDGLRAQVALLQVCRQTYNEAVPLILELCELVLGKKRVAGHGKRMTKVLNRILTCPLSAYIGVIGFKVESTSTGVAGGEIKLCAKLNSMAKKLRELRGLMKVSVACPEFWGKARVRACRVQMQRELCEGGPERIVEVEIRARRK